MEIGLGWGCALNLFAAYKLSHFKNSIHQGKRKGPVRRWRCKQPSSISSEVMCMKSRQPVEEIWKPKVRTDREGHFCCPHLSLLYVVGVLSHVWFFVTPWSVHTRLLCPWDFPGNNTGVGCYFLLQGIFLTQGLNSCILHQQADSLPLHHLGSLSPLVFIRQVSLQETPSTPSTNDIYSEGPLSKLWVQESLHNSIDGLGPHVGMILIFPFFWRPHAVSGALRAYPLCLSLQLLLLRLSCPPLRAS